MGSWNGRGNTSVAVRSPSSVEVVVDTALGIVPFGGVARKAKGALID